MRAPRVEAEQDSSICLEDLPEIVMSRKGRRLAEQRLVPSEAARHVAYTYDGPRALHERSWRDVGFKASSAPRVGLENRFGIAVRPTESAGTRASPASLQKMDPNR